MTEYLLVIDSLEFKKKDAYKSIYPKSEHYKVEEEFGQQRRNLLPGQIKNNYNNWSFIKPAACRKE